MFPLFGVVVASASEKGISIDSGGLSPDQVQEFIGLVENMTRDQVEKLYVLARVHHMHCRGHMESAQHNLSLPQGFALRQKGRLSMNVGHVPPDLQKILYSYCLLIQDPAKQFTQ